jgi:hypothetical protein
MMRLKNWARALLICALAAGYAAAQGGGALREFRDDEFGFRFLYPAEWKLEKLPDGAANPEMRVRLRGPAGSSFVVIVERSGEPLSKLEFQADPKGTMTDRKNGDISWNGNWKYGASINQADWTAEFSIPASDLGLVNFSSKEEINVSVSRSYPYGQSSDWSGTCITGQQNTANFQYGKWPEARPGKNMLAFKAQNQSEKEMKLQCELELIPLNEKPEFINQQGQGPSSDFQLKISSEPTS